MSQSTSQNKNANSKSINIDTCSFVDSAITELKNLKETFSHFSASNEAKRSNLAKPGN